MPLTQDKDSVQQVSLRKLCVGLVVDLTKTPTYAPAVAPVDRPMLPQSKDAGLPTLSEDMQGA